MSSVSGRGEEPVTTFPSSSCSVPLGPDLVIRTECHSPGLTTSEVVRLAGPLPRSYLGVGSRFFMKPRYRIKPGFQREIQHMKAKIWIFGGKWLI